MGVSNIIQIIIILLLILSGFSLTFIFIKREMVFLKRKSISFENYLELKRLFTLKLSPIVLTLTSVLVISLIVISCLIVTNDLLRVYLIPIGLIFCVVFIGLGLYLSSTRFNRDLTDFDLFYNNIESSYANKDKIIGNVSDINNKYNLMLGEVEKLQNHLKDLVCDFKGLPNIQECFAPLEKLKKDQEEVLKTFDNKMPEVFTYALIDYLEHGGVFRGNKEIFNPKINLNLEEVISSISKKVKAIYLKYLLESFLNLKHKSIDSLIEIVESLTKNKLFDIKYVDLLVKVINSDPNNSRTLIKYIFDKKYVNYKLIDTCINQNKDWVLEYPIKKLVTNGELTTLISNIVSINNINMTNKFLLHVDKGTIDLIQNGIKISSKNNESSEIMLKYIELLRLDGGFNGLSNRYENLALTLKDFFGKRHEENQTLNEIIDAESYHENSSFIESAYGKAYSSIEAIANRVFKSILTYSLNINKIYNYFVQEKINQIYVEYKRRLNYCGLLCLSSLLDAVLLVSVNDNAVISRVKKDIESLKGNVYDSYYPVTNNKSDNAKLYGKDIIQNLFRNHKEELSTLINHIESDRLMLDKIKYL